MGFRDALDLSHIVRRYEEFATAAGIKYVDGNGAQEETYERAPAHLYEPAAAPGTGEHPDLVGSGPRTCSTDRTVALSGPRFAWDPNRYYRDLRIPWPYVDATRKDLRLAYQSLGGPDNIRLTYCFKQLLNVAVRAEYDALPLGVQYLNDEYVQQDLKRRAAAEASRSSAKGAYTTAEQVMDDWGYVVLNDQESLEVESARSVDTNRLNRLDDDEAPQTVGAVWGYSFYLWKTQRWDYDRLAEWQAALVKVLDEQGISTTLTVGLMGGQPHPYAIAEMADEHVVFLNKKEQVSPDLALSAAMALHHNITGAKHVALSH